VPAPSSTASVSPTQRPHPRPDHQPTGRKLP
jgi:hypothetical protein